MASEVILVFETQGNTKLNGSLQITFEQEKRMRPMII